jgi:glyoxylate/hydroxypyruvate reductase A
MALLIATPGRESRALANALRRLAPALDLRVWPDCGDPAEIRFVLAWNAPQGLFDQLPNLAGVSSLGAGVDGLVERTDLGPELRLGRLAGPRLAADLAAYLVAVTVDHWKRLERFRDNQRAGRWQARMPRPTPTIGLLGTGVMGRKAAAAFAALDLEVLGWNRSRAPADGIEIEIDSGRDGLHRVAARADVLINLLPLTRDTRGILEAALFQRMRPDSLLINVGRGAHLNEADLLAALENKRPRHAVLDVFTTEPLPQSHPFWNHPQIRITPHCAGLTAADEAAQLALESYRRVISGEPPLGCVDRVKGY